MFGVLLQLGLLILPRRSLRQTRLNHTFFSVLTTVTTGQFHHHNYSWMCIFVSGELSLLSPARRRDLEPGFIILIWRIIFSDASENLRSTIHVSLMHILFPHSCGIRNLRLWILEMAETNELPSSGSFAFIWSFIGGFKTKIKKQLSIVWLMESCLLYPSIWQV